MFVGLKCCVSIILTVRHIKCKLPEYRSCLTLWQESDHSGSSTFKLNMLDLILLKLLRGSVTVFIWKQGIVFVNWCWI